MWQREENKISEEQNSFLAVYKVPKLRCMGSDYIVSDSLFISRRSSAPLCWSFVSYLWPWKKTFPGTGMLGEDYCPHSLWGPGLTFLTWNKWFLTLCTDQDCQAWNICPLSLMTPARYGPLDEQVTCGMKIGTLGQWRLVLHKLSLSCPESR